MLFVEGPMRFRLDQDLDDLRAAVDQQAAHTVALLAAGVARTQVFARECGPQCATSA